MSRLQILSLVALAGAAIWTYLPSMASWRLRFPVTQDTLGHMKNVMSIRASYESPEVQQAATALLQSLLQVK